MKKLLIAIAVIGFFAATSSSCKKDYTCECTVTAQGSTATYDFDYNKVKKSDAEDACSTQETTYKIGDPSASCSLK